MAHSFKNVCEIILDWASKGFEKCLVGAVCEQEKETETKKCFWRLKKIPKMEQIFNSRSLTRQVFYFLILLFCSLYKTNRFQFGVSLFSYRSQKTPNVERTWVTHSPAARVALFVFTTFWRLIQGANKVVVVVVDLWSITAQAHGKLESICLVESE